MCYMQTQTKTTERQTRLLAMGKESTVSFYRIYQRLRKLQIGSHLTSNGFESHIL